MIFCHIFYGKNETWKNLHCIFYLVDYFPEPNIRDMFGKGTTTAKCTKYLNGTESKGVRTLQAEVDTSNSSSGPFRILTLSCSPLLLCRWPGVLTRCNHHVRSLGRWELAWNLRLWSTHCSRFVRDINCKPSYWDIQPSDKTWKNRSIYDTATWFNWASVLGFLQPP